MFDEMRLPSYQKNRIFDYFRRFTDLETCQSLLDEVTEEHQRARPACPHCDSNQVIGHGRYRERQRYKCKDCTRTFNDFTNTPLHRTHYPHKWIKFLECILEGYSLRRCSIRVGISWVTLFYWRHKIIQVLQTLERDFPLVDIPYQNRRRARVPHYIPISQLLNSVPRPGAVHTGGTPLVATPPHELLKNFLNTLALSAQKPQQPKTTYLMVRKKTYYPSIPLPFHEKFVEWIQSFDRIAHKYWKRYVAWYFYLYKNPGASDLHAVRSLLLHMCSVRMSQTYHSLRVPVSTSANQVG